jgi:hypothetical protein
MNTFLNRLNLRPQERRLVVAVAAILFVVLNIWLVRPHFKDLDRVYQELKRARETLSLYQREADPKRIAEYQKRLKELESEGSSVLPEARGLDLFRTIQTQAQQHRVDIIGDSGVSTASSTKTNEFFEEKARTIQILTEEKNLVDFLVALGSTNSMIRVKSMNLRPDPSQMKLNGSITLVASYQKARPTKLEPASSPKTPALSARTRQPTKKP